MWQLEKIDIQGTRPLIMHNGDLADPLNQYVKQLKPLTAKRNKTEDTYKEIERLEFLGGLYCNEKNIIIPTRIIKKTIILAARKSKQGKIAESGLSCVNDSILQFTGSNGSHNPKVLWEREQFHYRVMVVVVKSRVPRMRPIFHEWKTTLSLHRDTDVLSKSMLSEWVKVAGLYVGFCELRPDYGRFEII